MERGDWHLYLRGLLNQMIARFQNRRPPRAPITPLPLSAILSDPSPAPLRYVQWLEGRSNAGRQALVGHYLEAKQIAFQRAPYHSFEGQGENFVVDLGGSGPLLILIAHHDAVPGSPGANDDASGVGVLLQLLEKLRADPPRRLRVRFLFTGDEERGYLGARGYVKTTTLPETIGVLSLELCGIGDSLAIWDVAPEWKVKRFVQALSFTCEALGYRCDETYHLVERIPVFGSDHRAFAWKDIPAFGLTVLPSSEVEKLREFIFKPFRPSILRPSSRPIPFDTYHTVHDRSERLEPAAMERVSNFLHALIQTLDHRE
jgi:Zn-dependent M28 family amino/carboxypeptidase